jgi:subtilisin-like proprotein convertase family protein
MKTTKFLLAIAIFSIISCSKSSDEATTPDNQQQGISAFENTNVLTIPDATCDNTMACAGSAVSELIINKAGTINDPTKVFLELNLYAGDCGEAVVELISPSGESCAIIKRLGTLNQQSTFGDTTDFRADQKLVFNSTFTTIMPFLALNGGDYIPAGNYRTEAGLFPLPTTVPLTPLNIYFANKNIQGTWKLKIYDFSKGEIIKLYSWKLRFDAGALK